MDLLEIFTGQSIYRDRLMAAVADKEYKELVTNMKVSW